jgi:hypothetical protein
MDIVAATILSTLFGSGIATAIVNQFFKRSLETQLEKQRAFLHRQSKVHELQIHTLMKLYSLLHSAHAPLRNLDDAKPFTAAVEAAKAELNTQRLLIPRALADKMDQFFEKLHRARTSFTVAFGDRFPEEKRNDRWQDFYTVAFEDIPELLRLIESDARYLIHGEK